MTNTISPYPSAYDSQKADEIWALLSENISETTYSDTSKALAFAVFGNSPYLATTAERFPKFAARCLTSDPDDLLTSLMAELRQDKPENITKQALMASLRTYKAQIGLLIAIADIAAWWSLDKITKALSDFADVCLELGLAYLLHERMMAGELPWPNGSPTSVNCELSKHCGYFILGMGKLGAHELNYSSDIDLIVFYDPSRCKYLGRKSLSECFIKITQELMQIIEQRTMHGYVFRTDLRLRPDPGATPLAISVEAAESYYHSMAANWERSAMIKARVVAGDFRAGADFLKVMDAWVWRKNMDFAALADIAAIKNQINRHYDQKPDYRPGFNVKLGHGGIREIEFYAQINQLLHAGRHPELRIRETLPTLELLVNAGFLNHEAHYALKSAYEFHRTLEHRLQMIQDAQTHCLPETADEMKHIACFMGYDTAEALLEALKRHCTIVSEIYDTLMPGTNEPDTATGFSEADIEGTLSSLGYDDIPRCMDIIQGWRHGRYRAIRTERAKRLLEACIPGLLDAFANTHAPVNGLTRFDEFISKLPAGVQLFSLIHSNPSLFKLLARVLGLAPALAETLSKKPSLWDMVLEPHFFAPIEDEETLNSELKGLLSHANDFQDILDGVRKYVAEQKFRTGVHILESLASTAETGAALTRVADVAIKALVPHVEAEFERRHGKFPGGGIAILAMGKYGGSELTHTSDLDIVFLYHTNDMDAVSDGEKPLPPSQYFSRLGQNIITAITALTPEGRLYEVDTRLRPSGSQGPLVVTLKTFQDYYTSSAWTWEHMALTRARTIIAPDTLKDNLDHVIHKTLTRSREHSNLLTSVADMREKLFAQFGSNNIWQIKHTRGGLVDIEFICQYLMLREGNKAEGIFHPHIPTSLKLLASYKIMNEDTADMLVRSQMFQQKVQSILRLCLGENAPSTNDIPTGLKEVLTRATKSEDFDALITEITILQEQTYNFYQKLIEEPAKLIVTE